MENATVSFEVSVSHDTVPVKWFHKNVEIKPSDKHRLVSERKVHKLMLQHISPSDAGEYTAVVGQLECKAKLFVESKYETALAALLGGLICLLHLKKKKYIYIYMYINQSAL